MNEAKILVGCPTSEHKGYCLKEYAEGLSVLSYLSKDVLLIDNSEHDDYLEAIKKLHIPVKKGPYLPSAKDRIVASRNMLIDVLLAGDYTYFLSLEQDVIPPTDVIERLLKHGKEIVSGVYFKEMTYVVNDKKINKGPMPLAYVKTSEEHMRQLSYADVKENTLKTINAAGVGCMLIHRSVFEKGKIRFRHVKDKEPFDDIWFCKDAEAQGYTLYLDTSIKCKHLTKAMDWDAIKK